MCSLYSAPSGVLGTFFSISILLELREPGRIVETFDHVANDLNPVGVLGRAAHRPLLNGVHGCPLALRGWRLEPTRLPTHHDFHRRFVPLDLRFHTLDVVDLVE